ncbi:glycerol-3-phosphate acyltransferase 2, mitochondrial isoform X2 [Polypterus senegalus]|uniref:glycerol-3-phosphate acyltransferase 2, mitochondrial isoform X2 n=1 Tax=Polypterus senegalus TaxID=55291 RepID=UPI001962F063|nr:glycerol-3-phosphate acyltransferase 2, mitochondrial isoform X2 [Polypterus senegalus]
MAMRAHFEEGTSLQDHSELKPILAILDAKQRPIQNYNAMETWSRKRGSSLNATKIFVGNLHPMVGQCCFRCVPESVNVNFLKNGSSFGFLNVLHMNEAETRYKGWLARRVCFLLFIWERNLQVHSAVERDARVLQSSRVKNILCHQKYETGNPCEMEDDCLRISLKIKTSISTCFAKFGFWLFQKVLGRVFINVLVSLHQVKILKEFNKKHKVPIIFVSAHKSAIDYILVPLALFCVNLQVPYTICGADLKSVWFRSLLHKLGMIIDPGLPSEPDSDMDSLHKAILISYVSEMLSEGQHLLLFLENIHGYSRRPSPASMLWLCSIKEAVRSAAIPDVAFVPVGVAYDSTVEGRMGHASQHQMNQGMYCFLKIAMSSIYRGLGCSRIDFGQPFLLKNFICRRSLSPTHLSLQDIFLNSSELLSAEKPFDWILPPLLFPEFEEQERHLMVNLSRHLLCSACSYTSVMSTSIFSCLLLFKHPSGVILSQLAQDFLWLLEEILFRNRDVGFGGCLSAVLYNAASLLKEHLVFCIMPGNKDVYILPKNTSEAVEALYMHAEILQDVFKFEALGACAVHAMLMEIVLCSNPGDMNFDVVLSQEELQKKIIQLSLLLSGEVLLLPPCQSFLSIAEDAVDSLVRCGVLIMEEVTEKLIGDLGKKHHDLMWKTSDCLSGSDSDCETSENMKSFKLSQSCPDMFFFLCRMLSPLLRALSWSVDTLQFLEMLTPASMEELHRFLMKKAQKEKSHYESCTLKMAATAVWVFKDLGILKEEEGDDKVVYLTLGREFHQPEEKKKLQNLIDQFLFV